MHRYVTESAFHVLHTGPGNAHVWSGMHFFTTNASSHMRERIAEMYFDICHHLGQLAHETAWPPPKDLLTWHEGAFGLASCLLRTHMHHADQEQAKHVMRDVTRIDEVGRAQLRAKAQLFRASRVVTRYLFFLAWSGVAQRKKRLKVRAALGRGASRRWLTSRLKRRSVSLPYVRNS